MFLGAFSAWVNAARLKHAPCDEGGSQGLLCPVCGEGRVNFSGTLSVKQQVQPMAKSERLVEILEQSASTDELLGAWARENGEWSDFRACCTACGTSWSEKTHGMELQLRVRRSGTFFEMLLGLPGVQSSEGRILGSRIEQVVRVEDAPRTGKGLSKARFWMLLGPDPWLWAWKAERVGAEAVFLQSFAGKTETEAVRAAIEDRLGAGALARIAWETAEKAGLGRVFFVAGTEREAEELERLGARRFDGRADALADGEDEAVGSFKVRCMGDFHTVELRGTRLRARDHSPEELGLLARTGEAVRCAELDGRRIWEVRDKLPKPAVDLEKQASPLSLVTAPYRFYGWNENIIGIRPGLRGQEESWRAETVEGQVIAKVAAPLSVDRVLYTIRDAEIAWSPVAAIAAEVVASMALG